MASKYSQFTRSFFDVELITTDRLLTSTPNRLESGNENLTTLHTFSKYVHYPDDVPWEVLISYKQTYPHPGNPQHGRQDVEWLVVTMDQTLLGQKVAKSSCFVVPFFLQQDWEDKKVILPTDEWYSRMPSVDQDDSATSQSAATPESSVLSASMPMAAQYFPSNENFPLLKFRPLEVVVSFYRTRQPDWPTTSDQLLDVFQLHCINSSEYRKRVDQTLSMLRSNTSTAKYWYNQEQQLIESIAKEIMEGKSYGLQFQSIIARTPIPGRFMELPRQIPNFMQRLHAALKKDRLIALNPKNLNLDGSSYFGTA